MNTSDANNVKMEASIAKLKATFEAIENAKSRVVVLDAPAPKSVASKKYIIKTEASKTDVVRAEAAKSIELSKQPATLVRHDILIAKKKVATKPKGKLSKLVKGKTVFDFSK